MTLQDQGRDFRRQLTQNKTIRDCVILVVIGHVFTYMAALVIRIWPTWSQIMVDWFWSPHYHMKMERVWYIQFGGQGICDIITYYLLAKIASKFSDSLFVVFVIFFGYHIVDAIMFWVNFNTFFYIYVDIFYTCLILIKYAIMPYRPEKFARLRSLF